MKSINLPVAELKPALLGLGKVINKNATLPVLSMIKVERTNDGWIALTGTDLDSFVTVRLEQPDGGQPGAVLVPFGELQALTKTCGKQDSITVTPATDDKMLLEYPIGAQRTGKRCDSIKVEEFPEIPRIKGDSVQIPENVRSAFHEAWECASTDETRYVLNSAYLDVSDPKCQCVVATDGRHLYSSNSFHLPVQSSLIIKTHRFLEWAEFSKDGEWRLKVREAVPEKEQALVQLSTRRWRFISKQIEGHYPNWRMVIPKDAAKTVIEIDPESCESIVQTIQRIPDYDRENHKIGIAVEQGVLLLLGKASAEDDQFISVPIPNAKITGRDIRLHINREFLTKALRFGLNTIGIEDALAPLKLTNGGRQMIIMPVRTGAEPVTPPSVQSADQGEAETGNSGQPSEQPTQPAAPITGAQPERKEPMAEVNKSNGSNDSSPSLEQLFDEVITGIDALRESLTEKAGNLKALGSKVKTLMKEQKSSMKEIQSVRQTLKSLQGVKL
jgi:DNA polymerase III sliding clamp (beta) subunit (PCNA family)